MVTAVGHAGLWTKKGGPPNQPPRFRVLWFGLQRLDVRGLQALGTLGDFEFNRLAIIQRLVAISHDCGEMDEYVLAALALDESKALAGIEPLHCSLFFTHCIYSFLLTALRSYFESGRVGT